MILTTISYVIIGNFISCCEVYTNLFPITLRLEITSAVLYVTRGLMVIQPHPDCSVVFIGSDCSVFYSQLTISRSGLCKPSINFQLAVLLICLFSFFREGLKL